ncbi:hypothetical protein C808_04332 [Lachnospiraceae bacterium M18-1]|nr:hypothetical protein C808_04332 [Lachnospiraceae bacterium M18-1]
MACLMSQDFINSFQLCGCNPPGRLHAIHCIENDLADYNRTAGFFISLIVTVHRRTGCLITVRSFSSAALRGSLR